MLHQCLSESAVAFGLDRRNHPSATEVGQPGRVLVVGTGRQDGWIELHPVVASQESELAEHRGLPIRSGPVSEDQHLLAHVTREGVAGEPLDESD